MFLSKSEFLYTVKSQEWNYAVQICCNWFRCQLSVTITNFHSIMLKIRHFYRIKTHFSWKSLHGNLDLCGQHFFTVHFYVKLLLQERSIFIRKYWNFIFFWPHKGLLSLQPVLWKELRSIESFDWDFPDFPDLEFSRSIGT